MTTIRLVFLALGAGMGGLIPFGTVILADKGFDAASIGLVLAVAATAGVLTTPIWGHLGDTVLGRRRVLQLASLGAAIALLIFGTAGIPFVAALAWVGFSATNATTMPTADAVAVNAVRTAGRGDFARLRLLVSLAFGSAAIATGFLYNSTGYAPAPYLAAACLGLVILASRLVPDLPPDPTAAAAAHRRGGSIAQAFAVQPRLPVVLLTFGLGIIGMLAVFTYLPLRIAELGGDPSDIALAAGLESIAEIPGFIVAGWIAGRFGLRALYVCSAVLMAGCGLVLVVLDSPTLMIGVRLLTGPAYAGLTVASVLALGVLLPAALQATAQGLSAMTMGIASIAVGIMGGLLYEVGGAQSLFAVTAGLTLVAAGIAWRVLPGRIAMPGRGGSASTPARTAGSGA
jgi:MFS transporter, PPP family, 3-phenylpropionic acid transporter